jgi:hypothetical protein
MRCLYCDKKLSLLKLAKGDSFCSPEHFDAHQLRASKSTFEHLRSPGIEETIAVPVPLKPPEEENHIWTEDPAEVPPAVPSPPYAPFSTSQLIPHPPNPTFLTAHGPDAARPELAFPIHGVEFTACLLNLYLRVSRSDTGPVNWELARHVIAAPMDFRPDLTRPPLALSPDFPGIENPLETPVELSSPVALCLPFLLAPSFGERTTPAIFLDAASCSAPKPSTLAPILDPSNLLRPDSFGAIPKPTVFAQATSLQVHDSTPLSIQSAPALAFPPDFILLPAAKGQAHLEGWHVSSRVIGLTGTAVETRWQSMRTLDFDPPNPRALLVRPDAVLVQSLRPLRIPSPQRPVSLTVSPISPNLTSTPELPRPEEPHCAFPVPPAAGTPQKLRTMLPNSLFVSVLETRPFQQEAVFIHPPPCPIELRLRSILAEFPAGELFSLALWRNQTPHFPLPESIADATELPAFELQPLFYAPDCLKKHPSLMQARTLTNQPRLTIAWHETHSGIPSSAPPKPAVAPPPLRFSGPDASRMLQMVSSVALPMAHDRVFAPAPNVLFAALDLANSGSTALPQIVGDPAGSVKIGLGGPSTTWEPRQPTSHAPLIAKTLPVRKSPVLPAARSWPRLGALPR